jgi:hypothetical protein
MNLYHCVIELRPEVRSIAFSQACAEWTDHLQSNGLINGWRLLRRKFGLSSGQHTDFLLEMEVPDLNALDAAFSSLAGAQDDASRRYTLMHDMIARAEVGLYRPFPDPA